VLFRNKMVGSSHEEGTIRSITVIAIVAALGIVASTAVNAFLMTTTPAYAAPAKDIVRDQVTGADAGWSDINVEVPEVGIVSFATLEVFETEAGTNIIVQLVTEEGNIAEGVTTIDPNVFEIDNNLRSATLSPVTIEVTIIDESSNPIGAAEITVQATWEGIGDILTQKSKFNTESEELSEKVKLSDVSRRAIAEGSIDNADLGTADVANLFAFKQVTMTVSESIIN
jgi:hypothetical protein